MTFINFSRLLVDLPINTMSLAKKTAATLVLPRSRPQPEELSSVPKLLMNIENRRGDKLHPKYVLKDHFFWFLLWGDTDLRVGIVRHMGDYVRICHFRAINPSFWV